MNGEENDDNELEKLWVVMVVACCKTLLPRLLDRNSEAY
jgi:hypothetical protein